MGHREAWNSNCPIKTGINLPSLKFQLMYRRLAFLLCVTCFFIMCGQNVMAQNSVTPGAIRFDATFENISINYTIEDDDNLNSELVLSYREEGIGSFQPGAKTMRAYPGLVIDGISTTRNFHAGSILFLEPNTTYEIECLLTDPNGGFLVSTHSVTTKAIPEPAANATVKYVAAGNGGGSGTMTDPYLGLQEAADNAQAGDHFLVAPGTYTPFSLTMSGTAASPICFTSEGIHAATIDGAGTTTGIITLGNFSTIISHIILDGFKIENGTWGIDAQNTQHVTVRNNIIQNVDYGYLNRRELGNEHDQYLTNNLILGNTVWPGSGIPSERGIDIRGNNNVVSFNTIKDFGDGVSTDGPPYETCYSLDIHNNEIQNAVDDLIEVDGIISNARVYLNRAFNGRAGVSLAPIFGGPAYVFRNVFYNMENSPFKMNRGPSGLIIAHNTVISEQNGIESPDGWQNTYYRNNVVMGTRYCFEFFGVEPGSLDDWDYDAYYSTRAGGSGTEWFKWDDIRYANVPVLQNSNIIEANAISVNPNDFTNVFMPSAWNVEYTPSQLDFTPVNGSPVINNGDFLDQMNEPFMVDGFPDRGAYEHGQPLPEYGHEFDFSTITHILMSPDCIEVFPNPFTDKVVLDGDFTNFTIQIFDSVGQLVSDHTGASAPFEIYLSSLPAGMYFVNVSSTVNNLISLHKIIKE